MAWIPVWECGFETQDMTELTFDPTSDQVSGVGLSFSNTFVRSGGFARLLSTGINANMGVALDAPVTRFRMGFAYRYAGISTTSTASRVTHLQYAGPLTDYRWALIFSNLNSTLTFGINGGIVDSKPISELDFVMNTYHDIGIQGNLVNDVAGFVSVYLDGNQIFHYSGAITSGPTGEFYGGGSVHSTTNWLVNTRMDDLYIDVADGVEMDLAPSTYRIEYLAVNGAGDSSQWTPEGAATNWEAVDDDVPDGDTTFVRTAAVDQLDLYTTAGNLATPVGFVPVGVRPVFTARKLDAGTDSRLVGAIKDGVNQDVGDSPRFLPVDYRVILGDYRAQRPSGGDWTEAAVNALQVGQMSKGNF